MVFSSDGKMQTRRLAESNGSEWEGRASLTCSAPYLAVFGISWLIAALVVMANTPNPWCLMDMGFSFVLVWRFSQCGFQRLASVKNLCGTGGSHGASDTEADGGPFGPQISFIDARCTSIGGEFGLTKRENEILKMLARGRNAEYISDALCVSSCTVKSHMGSIYRKLGVHCQQDLISLVSDCLEAA